MIYNHSLDLVSFIWVNLLLTKITTTFAHAYIAHKESVVWSKRSHELGQKVPCLEHLRQGSGSFGLKYVDDTNDHQYENDDAKYDVEWDAK